jgi:NitT/TauT family transport system substrate-binding protein
MRGTGITRRKFGKTLGAAAAGVALPAIFSGNARAADVVRHGLQIGAMGALRTSLPMVAGPDNLTFDVKDFTDSTAALLAIEQGDLEICNTTTQHLVRAISENIPVRWVCGYAGGYNVLVSAKALNLKQDDVAALKSHAA